MRELTMKRVGSLAKEQNVDMVDEHYYVDCGVADI